LRVPLDYRQPGGQTITVAAVRLRARDTAGRIGSLLVNPGGPGASGVQFVLDAAQSFPAAIRDRFDIVGFDPRGVGQSTPVRCLSPHALDEEVAADPVPDAPGELSNLVTLAKLFAGGCEHESGALLAHVSTLDEARDMDVLRAAVGDAKLTYLGFSYGTYLGAKYVQLFPSHIRALVLDGALDPSLTVDQLNEVQAEGFQTDLDDFLAFCVQGANCPLGSSVSAAMAELNRLTRAVDDHPLPGGGGRTAGAGEFFSGLAFTLYDPTYGWPALERALAAAERGNGAPILALSDAFVGRNPNGTYTNELESNTAINCVDRPSPTDLTTYERAAARNERIAPYFGAAIEWGGLACAYWPVPPAETPHAISPGGAPPILVVGTTRDPATPYQWAQALARQLRTTLLSYNSDGHTAYLRSGCIDGYVDAYLIARQLPRPGTVCS